MNLTVKFGESIFIQSGDQVLFALSYWAIILGIYLFVCYVLGFIIERRDNVDKEPTYDNVFNSMMCFIFSPACVPLSFVSHVAKFFLFPKSKTKE